MKIAIASHNRLNLLSKTLTYLQNSNIDLKDVFIFSSSESYEEYLENFTECNIIKSKDNILQTRNHIIEYFAENEKIVEIDDDIQAIIDFETNEVVNDLYMLFYESFLLCDGLFGFSSNDNAFFSNKKDKFGLYSIVNSCCGYTNDKSIKLTLEEKEDFERVILFYEKDKKILKRGRYGIKTKYWKNKGGIQDRYDFETRKKVQEKCADILVAKYSHLGYKTVRKNGICDFKFKPRRS